MKQLVCASCGQTVIAVNLDTKEKVCMVCDSKEFKLVVLPDDPTCIYCKKISKTEDLLERWKTIPFFDSNSATYYCGCRGWD